jgi:hypothetical protein
MCGGSTVHLLSIEEMIAQATAEYSTVRAAETTETQQVAITQLEGAIHVGEVNIGECSTMHEIYGKGTDPLDEDGDIIGMDSNTSLAFATESEDIHDVNMLEPHDMANDAITQPHTPSMHEFLSIAEAGTSSSLCILIVDLVYSLDQ